LRNDGVPEISIVFVILAAVAFETKRLKIIESVRATLAARNDMVNMEPKYRPHVKERAVRNSKSDRS
jgi:hypothetical protein